MPASCASRLFDDGQNGISPMHTYFVTCQLYSLVHPQCIYHNILRIYSCWLTILAFE